VPEYWILLAEENALEQLVLESGAYRSAGRLRESAELRILLGVVVDLTRLWV
jgi:hypothetical protein